MNHAIAQLGIAADIAEHNLPYSEQAGHAEQAALQREVAGDCREAIEQLQSEDQGSEQGH
ncbi:hypothetical protein [Pseudomonas alcaligenes]|uniref:hypothetical protein n=1 Tax=Aquipseudomonas alcaligenes TaxID=43263 RepID=UPI00358E1464